MGGYWVRAVMLAAGVTGCFIKPDAPGVGDAGTGPDSLDAATVACTQWGPWGSAQELVGLNASNDDFGASLTRDELRIVWSRGSNLMEAERPTIESDWINIRQVSLFGFGGGPLISGDGLRLYFHKYEPGPDANIMVTGRPSLTAAWEPAGPYGPFNTVDDHERDLEISWNGLDAVVFVGEDSIGHQEDIAIASRSGPDAIFNGWERIPSASRAGTYDCCPGISPDGLEVYWETDAIWRVRRSDRASAFDTAEKVIGLSDPGFGYGDPHFNALGNRLYFSREPQAVDNFDLYVVERACAD